MSSNNIQGWRHLTWLHILCSWVCVCAASFWRCLPCWDLGASAACSGPALWWLPARRRWYPREVETVAGPVVATWQVRSKFNGSDHIDMLSQVKSHVTLKCHDHITLTGGDNIRIHDGWPMVTAVTWLAIDFLVLRVVINKAP